MDKFSHRNILGDIAKIMCSCHDGSICAQTLVFFRIDKLELITMERDDHMRINAFLIKRRILFSFLLLLVCLNLGTGCDNSSSSLSSNSFNGSVSGAVVGGT